ncbi:hypothetical protein PTTG_26747 [Puccinia triticina 1-1 BBBD Race 1]|uniref:Uncharacterized protein n=1 Tax=Puccinia triticina (isolate 1-1 / race 1 (BBBD)) TaxID=630390 RepID=A0A180GSF2_PUCT1|nr:hypothetical protein PTTG_30129 [Puccinia triticina 1-1 BBBD Race 1]OAV95232.1 hypothetical protein PTTG_26747 [Puccinia triticina 1-1 BBBD Race 1]
MRPASSPVRTSRSPSSCSPFTLRFQPFTAVATNLLFPAAKSDGDVDARAGHRWH